MKGKTLATLEGKVRFVQAAVSKDTSRIFMCSAYYDQEAQALVATDGRRMHIAYLSASDVLATGLKESTYVALLKTPPFVATVNQDTTFPNWRRVLPASRPAFTLDTVRFGGAGWEAAFALKARAVVNMKYLEPLAGEAWQVTPGADHTKAIRFDSFRFVSGGEVMQASCVVMPMGGDRDETLEEATTAWVQDIAQSEQPAQA